MPTPKIKLGNKEYPLARTFAVGARIAESVGDPLVISRQYMTAAIMEDRGLSYTPPMEMTLSRTALVLFIAANEANNEVTLEEIQEAIIEHGALDACALALNFLAEYVGIRGKEDLPNVGKDSTQGE